MTAIDPMSKIQDWGTDFDILDPDYVADPAKVWADLRPRCPIANARIPMLDVDDARAAAARVGVPAGMADLSVFKGAAAPRGPRRPCQRSAPPAAVERLARCPLARADHHADRLAPGVDVRVDPALAGRPHARDPRGRPRRRAGLEGQRPLRHRRPRRARRHRRGPRGRGHRRSHVGRAGVGGARRPRPAWRS